MTETTTKKEVGEYQLIIKRKYDIDADKTTIEISLNDALHKLLSTFACKNETTLVCNCSGRTQEFMRYKIKTAALAYFNSVSQVLFNKNLIDNKSVTLDITSTDSIRYSEDVIRYLADSKYNFENLLKLLTPKTVNIYFNVTETSGASQ